MVREAPALMDDAAAIRAMFPGARMTYFSAGPLELGVAPKDGWVVDCPIPKTEAELAEIELQKKVAEKQHAAIKRKMKK